MIDRTDWIDCSSEERLTDTELMGLATSWATCGDISEIIPGMAQELLEWREFKIMHVNSAQQLLDLSKLLAAAERVVELARTAIKNCSEPEEYYFGAAVEAYDKVKNA